MDDFSRNKLAVERRMNARSGVCNRTWYEPTRVCTIGDSEEQSQLCNDTKCSVCQIIKVITPIYLLRIEHSHVFNQPTDRTRSVPPPAHMQRRDLTKLALESALIQSLRRRFLFLSKTPHRLTVPCCSAMWSLEIP